MNFFQLSMWIAIALLCGSIVMSAAKGPQKKQFLQCQDECKDKGGEPDSVCGRKKVGNSYAYKEYKNECEATCVGREVVPMKECRPDNMPTQDPNYKRGK